jgi:hypothetical protein
MMRSRKMKMTIRQLAKETGISVKYLKKHGNTTNFVMVCALRSFVGGFVTV